MTPKPPRPSPSPAAAAAPIDAGRLSERLRAIAPALTVEALAETRSTNDLAMARLREHAGKGPPAPYLAVAERQTAGRGRLGRTWHSPPGLNLAFSVALPLASPHDPLPEATPSAFNLAAAAIVCIAIERASALRPAIKWPNDVHAGDCKLAGILSELPPAPPGGAAAGIVVGIGLNVNALEEDFPPELRATATSLRRLTGAAWDRQGLLESIAGDLLTLAASRQAADWSEIAAAWRARCDTLGRWVSVVSGADRISGTAQGLEPDGALVLRLPDGRRRRIDGGEVTLEKG
jgi:BirA family biotin operon repressor/biotin-[acetyl-CoA-carboxylase] ligase